MTYPFYAVMWTMQVFVLFLVFTVQAAMWRAAEEANRNGWVIALLFSVLAVVLLNGIDAMHDIYFPHH